VTLPPPDWPDTPAAARSDWRDTLRAAADLALLGIVTTAASAAVLTTGAALSTASTAIHRWTVDGHWPSLRELAVCFWRGLLPGAVATVVGLGTLALLGGNAVLISAGVVPGGTVMLAGTLLLLALVAGLAGITVVQTGRGGIGPAGLVDTDGTTGLVDTDGSTGQDGGDDPTGQGWRAAVRDTWRIAERRPLAVLAATGVVSLAALLTMLTMPILAPILLGYTLFALHTALRRLAQQPSQ
jgi:hypothetical protein